MTTTAVLNHVALSVDKELLDGPKRDLLKDFFSSVFGWEEIPQLTNDGKRLVFRLYRRGQFLYLISGDLDSGFNYMNYYLDLEGATRSAELISRFHGKTPEYVEGPLAFAEKRKPSWQED
ncbi:MAG: hypothetical protein IIB12_01570 [Chloroflexi bacterium]|nr:hypothetical protein [Chloroflexota bacterium]